MARVRVLLVALFGLLIASQTQAAPAPMAKSPRQPPSLATLSRELRAEGFDVRGLERGPEPGLYRITIAPTPRSTVPVPCQTHEVRVTGGDVRAELRAFLVQTRPALKSGFDQDGFDGFVW
jgi:hypothetical protein